MKSGDYAHAAQLFTRAINSGKLSNDDKEFAFVQRGTAYLNLGKTKDAVQDFQRALKLKPDDDDARQELQQAKNSGGTPSPRNVSGGNGEEAAQAGADAMSAGDYARAITLFSRAIDSGRLNSDDVELAYLSRGNARLQRGDYRAAIGDLDNALHRKPDDQEALQAFGQALSNLHAAVPVDGIDAATCNKNFHSVGSFFEGETYTGFAEYPGLSTLDAFAGLYTALGQFTPSLGLNWQITSANLQAGIIAAAVTYNTGRSISLEAHIEPLGGGSRITMKEAVPTLLPTTNLKGSVCSTLAAAAKG
jgi:tetratricopeptide (TPR) repeat protein